MNTENTFIVPTDQALIEWFGIIPLVKDKVQYHFAITDKNHLQLLFSFDVVEQSVQTLLKKNDVTVVAIVHEDAKRIWLEDCGDKKVLRADFHSGDHNTSMSLDIQPTIQIKWSTLRK